MTNRPPTISIKDLSKAVEHAVKVASAKHKVQFSPEFRMGPGTIIGRKLVQADIELTQAKQIATEVTQHVVTDAGTGAAAVAAQFEPAVLIRGRDGTTIGMIASEPDWKFE